MTVISGDDMQALCARRGETASVSMMLVGAQEPGSQVLVHLGTAMRVLGPDEARAIDDALEGLQAALNGENFENFFADLIEREPELPAFLQDHKTMDNTTSPHEVALVDENNAEAILSAAGKTDHILLFFPGDPVQCPETNDVAVIFPQLLTAFGGRLRGAIVAPGAERSLSERFHVDVLPSLAVVRAGETIGVIARVRDWADYLQKIEGFLDPQATPLPKVAKPRVEFTFSTKGATA